MANEKVKKPVSVWSRIKDFATSNPDPQGEAAPTNETDASESKQPKANDEMLKFQESMRKRTKYY